VQLPSYLSHFASHPLEVFQPTSRNAASEPLDVPAKPFPRLFLPGNLSRFILAMPRNARQSQILHDFWCYCPQDCQRTSLVRAVARSGFPEFSAKARGWLENMASGFEIYRCIAFIIQGFTNLLPANLSSFGPSTVRARSSGSVERLIGTIHASQPLIRKDGLIQDRSNRDRLCLASAQCQTGLRLDLM
jgi:hypothetical protein